MATARTVFGFTLIVASLSVAAPASAQDCEGRPGASAILQYCEAIPEATPPRETKPTPVRQRSQGATSGSSAAPPAPAPAPRLSPASRADLAARGTDGAAVAGIVAAGPVVADPSNTPRRNGSRSQPAKVDQDTPDDERVTPAVSGASNNGPPPNGAASMNPIKAVVSAAAGGAGVGSGLIGLLLVLTVGVLGFAWTVARRPPGV